MSMARRNNNKMTKRMPKIEPSVLELRFNLPALGVPSFLDLNQINSLVNRRFYRQGLVNAVQSIEVQFTPNPGQTAATGTVTVSKMPSTWVFSNAWHKSFATWQRMNNEALEESESVRPRFLDFKIYADSDHHLAGFAQNMKPFATSTGIGVPNLGEWEASKLEIPTGSAGTQGATASRELIGTGGNYPGVGASGLDAVSLIEGYAASRGLPNIKDPNAPADAADVDGFNPDNWMSAVFNEGTTQTEGVLEDMITENNIAPYPFEGDGVSVDTQYPGGQFQFPGMQFHDKLLITTSTIGGSDTAIGGLFPCGLIRFDTEIENGTAEVIVRLVAGTHRGLMAFSMQDM